MFLLRKKTGLFILFVGLIILLTGEFVRFLLESSTIEASLTMVRILYDLSILFSSDIGPGMVAFAVGLLISSRRRFERTYLQVVVVGVFVMALTFTLMRWDITELLLLDFRGILFVYSLFYAVGPMLFASGVVAGVIVERERKTNNGPNIDPTKDVALLIVLVTSLLLPYIAVANPNPWLLLWVCVIWFIWHIFTPYVANCVVLGFRRSTRRKTKNEYKIKSIQKPIFEPLTFHSVLSKAYIPTAFGLGATFTIYRFLKLTPIQIEFTPGPFGTVADTTSYAIWAIALGALFVGPVVWLLKDDEIALYDPKKSETKIPTVHNFLLGMTQLYGFVLGPFLFVFLETERDYLLTLTLLPLMLYTIFTVSLASTLLYLILSHKRNMDRFLKSILKTK